MTELVFNYGALVMCALRKDQQVIYIRRNVKYHACADTWYFIKYRRWPNKYLTNIIGVVSAFAFVSILLSVSLVAHAEQQQWLEWSTV